MALIKGIARDNNQTIVMVTHDPRLAEFADKIIRILDGKIQSVEMTKNAKAAAEIASAQEPEHNAETASAQETEHDAETKPAAEPESAAGMPEEIKTESPDKGGMEEK